MTSLREGSPSAPSARAQPADATSGRVTPARDTAADTRPSPGRLVALDVARAAAIVGMLAVNIGPRGDTGLAALVIRSAHGRASLLFVLLAGVGISLLTRRARAGGPSGRRTLVWRSAVLLAIGLALQALDHDVSVILPTYAALFVLAAGFCRLADRYLLVAAAATAVLGPLVWIAGQAGTEYAMEGPSLTDSPAAILASVVISGPYPLVTWLAPFLLGMWLGRRDLTSRRLQVWLVAAGTVAAVGGLLASRALVNLLGQPGEQVGPDRLVSAVAHSQMPLWLLSATGSAAVVLGVLLLLVPHVRRWARPFVALGQLSLTMYVAHLVVLAAMVRPGPWNAQDGLLVTAVIVAIALPLATAWRERFARGPLEAALRVPTRRLG